MAAKKSKKKGENKIEKTKIFSEISEEKVPKKSSSPKYIPKSKKPQEST